MVWSTYPTAVDPLAGENFNFSSLFSFQLYELLAATLDAPLLVYSDPLAQGKLVCALSIPSTDHQGKFCCMQWHRSLNLVRSILDAVKANPAPCLYSCVS